MFCRPTIPSFFRAETWNTHTFFGGLSQNYVPFSFSRDSMICFSFWKCLVSLNPFDIEYMYTLHNPCFSVGNEPWHDKTNKMSVRPAKTQISLGTRPVWSESSLSAQWVAKGPRFLHVDREDSDQTGRMPRLIWVFAGRTLTLLVFSCCGSNVPVRNHNFGKQL